MTRTIYQIDDAGGALSWSALSSFIKNLGGDSALARELGKSTGWENTKKTNELLADIFDLLQNINFNIVAFANSLAGKKITKNFSPYPRPGKEDNTKRKLGKDALPLPKLREWIRSKQNGRR